MLAFQILTPFLIIGWVLVRVPRSAVEFWLHIAGAALFLGGLWTVGIWVYPPSWAPLAYLILLTVGVFFARRRIPTGSQQLIRWRDCMAPALAAIVGAAFLWQGFAGRMSPDGPFVDLISPLHGEQRYCVVSGGASPLLNLHYATIDPSNAFRGQSYGADIVAVGRNGFRTHPSRWYSPQPKEPQKYSIFGAAVYSPCAGEVVAIENNSPDLSVGEVDLERMAGNHVILQCGDAHILLAHMRQGSVTVQPGSVVEVGDQLGVVGNTGHTSEPHLHIHAQAVPENDNRSFSASPKHMRFNGRFMARGDCF